MGQSRSQQGTKTSQRSVGMTPVQQSLEQQLRVKHAELSKRFKEQQAELEDTSQYLSFNIAIV